MIPETLAMFVKLFLAVVNGWKLMIDLDGIPNKKKNKAFV